MSTEVLDISKFGVSKEVGDNLLSGFDGFMGSVEEIKKDCLEIVIDDVGQKDLIKKAKEYKRKVAQIRIDCEKERKKRKESSLREGKAIDGIANYVKFIIAPIEEHLSEQANFVKRIEEKAFAELIEKRKEQLEVYTDDTSVYAFQKMSEEEFLGLIESLEKAKAAREEAAKAEALRLQKEAEEREAMRLENERLQAEADAKIAEADAKIAEARRIQDEKDEKARLEREALEAKVEEARQAELKIEREKAKALAEELAAKRKIETEQAEAERVAKLAPDIDKMKKYVDDLRLVEPPEVKDEECLKLLKSMQKRFDGFLDCVNKL